MAYTVNANDPSRPLDTDPRKQGAEELRALKARLIQTRTELEGADSTNAASAAAALAAALAAQSTANAAQSTANNAQSTANNAQSSAASAAGAAAAAAAAAALSVVKIKSIQVLTSGSGNVTVPTDSTQCLAIGKGGDRQGYSSIAATVAATKATLVAVQAGASLAYSVGTVAADTSFAGITFPAAPILYLYYAIPPAWTATSGWLVLVFY